MAHIRTELLLNELGLTTRTELLIELVRLLPELAGVRLAKLLLNRLLAYLARLDGAELGGWGSHRRTELAPCLC